MIALEVFGGADDPRRQQDPDAVSARKTEEFKRKHMERTVDLLVAGAASYYAIRKHLDDLLEGSKMVREKTALEIAQGLAYPVDPEFYKTDEEKVALVLMAAKQIQKNMEQRASFKQAA